MGGLPGFTSQGTSPASPLLGILAGIAQGASGFMQGRAFRNQERMQSQEMDLRKQQMQLEQERFGETQKSDAAKQLDMYRNLAVSDPALAKSPDFLAAVNAAGQPLGINYGNELPPTFTQMPVGQLLQGNTLSQLAALPPETRAMFKGKISGIADEDPFWSKPSMITNPIQQAQFPKMVGSQLEAVGQGKLDPNQFVAWVRATAPRFGYNPEDLFDAGTIGQLGAVTKAKVDDLVAKTGVSKAKIPYIAGLMQSEIKRNLAGAANQGAMAQTQFMKAQAEVTKAQAAAKNADTNAQKVHLQIVAAQQLGGRDPRAVGALNAAMRNLQSQVKEDRQALDAVNNQWVKLMAIPGATSPGTPERPNQIAAQVKALQDQAASIKARLDSENGQLQQFSTGYKGIVQSSMRAQGAPNSWKPADDTKPPQNTKGVLSRADVIRIGAQHGLKPDAAIKDAESRGYTVH